MVVCCGVYSTVNAATNWEDGTYIEMPVFADTVKAVRKDAGVHVFYDLDAKGHDVEVSVEYVRLNNQQVTSIWLGEGVNYQAIVNFKEESPCLLRVVARVISQDGSKIHPVYSLWVSILSEGEPEEFKSIPALPVGVFSYELRKEFSWKNEDIDSVKEDAKRGLYRLKSLKYEMTASSEVGSDSRRSVGECLMHVCDREGSTNVILLSVRAEYQRGRFVAIITYAVPLE